MSRKPRKEIYNYALKEITQNGFVNIDEGDVSLVIRKLNDENFSMTDKFKEQLENENLMDTFICFLVWNKDFNRNGHNQFSMGNLPIYGNKDKYVTKWFGAQSIQDAFDSFISSSDGDIAKRIEQYKKLDEGDK